MAKIQDIDIPYLEFAEAAAPGTPASGIVRIYAKSDGSLYQKDDAGTETGLAGGGGGGTYDPIAAKFGAPDTAFEFNTTSLAGLTAMGSADTEDADTTYPGALFLADLNASYTWCSRYLSSPTPPWTAITKIVGNLPAANYNGAGIWIGVATPGNMDVLWHGHNGAVSLEIDRVTPTAYGSTISVASGANAPPIYLAIRCNSATSFDYLYSYDGVIWRAKVAGRNPSITVATLGIGVKAENGSTKVAAAFDFLRIWNSAKTFLGT